MSQPLTRAHLLPKIQGIEAWGACEYTLRRAIEQRLASQRWQMHGAIAATRLTLSLYAQRGLAITHDALCPAYDLLRHGRPIDFDLLHEARTTQAMITHHYCSAKPLTMDRLDAWLRDMLVLANTIGSYEDHGSAGLGVPGGLGAPLGGNAALPPFKLPPGPLNALRSEIKANLATLPPLLSVIASMAALSDFAALYPNALTLAEGLLLPGLVSLAFQRPAIALYAASPDTRGLTLECLHERAKHVMEDFDRTQARFTSACEAVGARRTGSMLPKVLEHILQTPLFTSKSIAHKIGCSPRTVEKLVLALEARGQITAMQRSGRLVLWSAF